MRIEVTDPAQDPRYSGFVMRHAAASIYHHPLWKSVIERAFHHLRAHYLVASAESGEIAAVLPGFLSGARFSRGSWTSVPMACYCDPLTDSEESLRAALSGLSEELRRGVCRSVEVRSLNGLPFADSFGVDELTQYLTHILPIDGDLDSVYKAFHKTSVQQRIKQAERAGLELRFGDQRRDVDTFFGLHILNRRALGLPPLPRAFFHALWEFLQPAGLLFLPMVYSQGDCISAMVLLKFRQRAHAEYTASHPEFLHCHPNHLITWRAIELAKQEGCTEFDLGRSSIDNQGLISYKERWGATATRLHYYCSPGASSFSAERRDSVKFRVARHVFARMPPRVLEAAGSVFYQHLY
jgi:CelD/BcsL family acetyltransferase involved in cellulose biosynthesis